MGQGGRGTGHPQEILAFPTKQSLECGRKLRVVLPQNQSDQSCYQRVKAWCGVDCQSAGSLNGHQLCASQV